jgi:hypothetical protein
MLRKILILLLLAVVFSSCSPPASALNSIPTTEVVAQAQEIVQVSQQQAPKPTQPEPTVDLLPAPTGIPASSPVKPVPIDSDPVAEELPLKDPVGPDQFPAGISPLTGLPVKDAANLAHPPALVSITNFPTTARPQSGLSFSPFVFEMYIGEGMTRFLAVFYGDFPQKGEDQAIALSDDKIGPVRSGRLPYESLRKLYNGFLVMASASPNVKSNLNSFTNVWGSDTSDINSAMISATRLEEIAKQNPDQLDPAALSGLAFDEAAPDSGQPGTKIWIPYNYLNQIIWKYDTASGAYHRYQDNADGTTFIQATDRLNGDALTYENVVILFATHAAERETLIDINFMYVDRLPALVFRDGKMYEAFWTTANGEYEQKTGQVRPIRFVDAQGNPFPLKPGQTWVEIVQMYTRYNETVDSQVYFDLKTKTNPGSGVWAVHFFPTVPER